MVNAKVRRSSLRLRLLGIGRDYDDRERGHVQRYVLTPAPGKTTRRKARRQAVMDAEHMLLLAFIIGGALWILFTPSLRTFVQQVEPTISTLRTP